MIGTRNYGNNYLLQNVFDYDNIPDKDSALKAFSKKVLSPKIQCIEQDCGTSIGRRVSTLTRIEGLVSLSNLQVLTEDSISELLSNGEYYVRVRDGSTCLSDGVCSLCYYGSSARYGDYVYGSVGSMVELTGSPAAYQAYLAGTYSGSLMGYKEVPSEPLPYHHTVWKKVVSHREMDLLCSKLANLGVPSDEVTYIKSITDHLEKALTIIAYYGVYSG